MDLRTRHGISDIPIRRSPREKLDNGAAKRPNVRFGRCALELDDFRCHPVGRAGDVFDLALHGTQVQRDAKVRELHVPVLGREDVRRLEIAMHHVASVEVVQPFENLDDVTRHQLLVELSECLEGLSERPILGISARGDCHEVSVVNITSCAATAPPI